MAAIVILLVQRRILTYLQVADPVWPCIVKVTPRSATKAWFKRRILHAPNQILILVDSNEYVRLIWFKRRNVLPNKIADASDVF